MSVRPIRRILLSGVLGLTACGGRAAPAAPTPPAPPPAPVLRIGSVSPPLGAPVDSTTELKVTVLYEVPAFEERRAMTLTLTFRGSSGGTFNRPPDPRVAVVDSAGAVTLRYPLRQLLRDSSRLARPLTAYVLLLEPLDADSTNEPIPPRVPGGEPLARVRRAGTIRARSEALFFGGAGPAPGSPPGPPLPFPRLLAEYLTFGGRKALAVARDSRGRWSAGYGFGFRDEDAAVFRALSECRRRVERRGLDAACELYAIDNEILRKETSR